MMEAYLGEDAFRSGIRHYIAARKYSNATATDLWNALGAAGHQDVAAIAGGWTTQPGFPLVSVSASCDAAGKRTIALRQQRFLYSGSDGGRRWHVPMHVASGGGPAQSLLLRTDGQTAAAGRCDEPLRANAGDVGYYRVAYDAPTLAANQRGFAGLPEADKIALLDDQWALARAGQAPLSAYLALAGAMKAAIWTRARGSRSPTRSATLERDERGGPGHAAFLAYARSVVAAGPDACWAGTLAPARTPVRSNCAAPCCRIWAPGATRR